MEIYRKNGELLEQAVMENAAIFPIERHRREDGSLDVEGNLEVWNKALASFHKTYLWENGAPGFDAKKTPLQEEPYFVFVPTEDKRVRGTIVVAHGGGFSWRTGSEGVNVAHYFWKAGFNVAILSYRLLPYC